MNRSKHRVRLTVKGIAAAKPKDREYTIWDNLLGHFGVRVQPSGVRSYIVQTRVNGRMRKVTLGRFPELPLGRGPAGRRGRACPTVGRRGRDAAEEEDGAAVSGTSPSATASGAGTAGSRPRWRPTTSTCGTG